MIYPSDEEQALADMTRQRNELATACEALVDEVGRLRGRVAVMEATHAFLLFRIREAMARGDVERCAAWAKQGEEFTSKLQGG